MSLKQLFYGSAIFFSYLLFGIYQEQINRKPHGPNNEKFTCTMTLVLIQCIVSAIFGKFLLNTFMKQPDDRTNWFYYSLSSLSYLTAMVSSNTALQHVSYPTQVVAKSCKPIPIMIMGVFLSGKKYSSVKYLFVSFIVAGVAIFMYKKEFSFEVSSSSDVLESIYNFVATMGSGEALLLLSLGMDGVTGAVQERMKSNYQTKSVHMMYKMNLWSSFYLVGAILFTGEYKQFTSFISRHPNLIFDISMFAGLSALGQLFIFLTITDFGPLPCSIITTTRKFFTVLCSVFLLGNEMSTKQWIGTALVFTGLTLDSIWDKRPKTSNNSIKLGLKKD